MNGAPDDALAGLLSEALEEALLVLGPEGALAFVSRAAREMLAAEGAEGLDALLTRVRADDRADVRAMLARPPARPARLRFRVERGSGPPRALELQVRPAGERHVVRLHDVVLPELEPGGALEQIARQLQDVLWLVDVPGQQLLYVSPGYESLFRRSRETLRGGPSAFYEAVHPADRERLAKAALEGFESGFVEEFRIVLPEGAVRWVRHRSVALPTPDGRTLTVGITSDIDERRRSESARLDAERRFAVLCGDAFETMSEVDARGRVVWTSTRIGVPFAPPDPEGRPRTDLVHPEDRVRAAKRFASALSEQRPATLELRAVDENGVWRWLETSLHPFRTDEGEARGLFVSRDVSERRALLEELRDSEERFRQLVEQSPAPILVTAEGHLRYANPAAVRLLGAQAPEQLVGRPARDVLDADPAMDSIPHEFTVRRLDGSVREVMGSHSAIRFDGSAATQTVLRDITEWRIAERERQRLLTQLQEVRKLESLGVLAGGIAHDFNNLLAVILGNVNFARRQGSCDEESRAALDDAVDAGESAARLTRQLLAYAGRRAPEVRPVDLSEHVRSIQGLLEAALPKKVDLHFELADGLPSVRADVVQLEQVTMNLVRNAAEAIGDREGHVTVSTGRARVDEGASRRLALGNDLPCGDYAYLEVRDDGEGMVEETRQRIFDPFFTTKKAGHGLGLSAVLGLVRGHAGGIELSSEPGRGTTIRVYLPASGLAASPAPHGGGVVAPVRATVLIADDEPGVRRMLRRILESRGCAVEEAEDGVAAVEVWREHADRIDAVILDLNMPRAGGEEALRRLRELAPELPVVLSTGDDLSQLAERVENDPYTSFLSKPYLEAELFERIAALIR